MQNTNADAGTYTRNHKFLMQLRDLMQNGRITRQEMLTLRGQALAGDSDGAQKGLARLMRERYL